MGSGHLVCFDFLEDSTQWSCLCGFKSTHPYDVLKHADAWNIKQVPFLRFDSDDRRKSVAKES